jgi:hypothetical protein
MKRDQAFGGPRRAFAGDPELAALVGDLEAFLRDAGQENRKLVGRIGLIDFEAGPASLLDASVGA